MVRDWLNGSVVRYGGFAGEREVNAMLCMVQSEHGREEGRFPEPIWWIPGCSGVDCRLDKGNPKIAEGLQTLSWVLPSFARASVAEGRRRLISVASKSFSRRQ